MMYSLNVNSIRSLIKKRGKDALSVLDLPRYTRDHLDLRALNLSTDLLSGLGRSAIEQILASARRTAEEVVQIRARQRRGD